MVKASWKMKFFDTFKNNPCFIFVGIFKLFGEAQELDVHFTWNLLQGLEEILWGKSSGAEAFKEGLEGGGGVL